MGTTGRGGHAFHTGSHTPPTDAPSVPVSVKVRRRKSEEERVREGKSREVAKRE